MSGGVGARVTRRQNYMDLSWVVSALEYANSPDCQKVAAKHINLLSEQAAFYREAMHKWQDKASAALHDAERYRWLRAHAGEYQGPEVFIAGKYELGSDMDKAIDAAMIKAQPAREWWLQSDPIKNGWGPFESESAAWRSLFGRDPSAEEIRRQEEAGWYVGIIDTWGARS